jgi:hypothetical protein
MVGLLPMNILLTKSDGVAFLAMTACFFCAAELSYTDPIETVHRSGVISNASRVPESISKMHWRKK